MLNQHAQSSNTERGAEVRGLRRTGEPNAQIEDQVGRQKALQDHRHRQSPLCPVRQAPRHDQADQEDRSASTAAPRSCSRPMATRSRNISCPTADRPGIARRKEISHGSRQTWRHRARQAQKGSQGRQGLLRPAQEHDPHCQAGGREGQSIRLPRPQAAQAHFPRAVDPADERGGAAVRLDLQPIHRRPRQGRDSGRPQSALRSRHSRAGGLPEIVEKAKAALPA